MFVTFLHCWLVQKVLKNMFIKKNDLQLGLWCPNLCFDSSEKSDDYCQNSEVNEEGDKENL